MHIDKFMPILKDHTTINNNPPHMAVPWDIYRKYAKLTALIDYKCGFNKAAGTCEKYVNITLRSGETKRAFAARKRRNLIVCCGGCSYTIGYLDYVPDDQEVFKLLAKKFSKASGFWRKGIGCNLPREHRSPTCLYYNCGVRVFDSPRSKSKWLLLFFHQTHDFRYRPDIGLDYKDPYKGARYRTVLPVPEELEKILQISKKRR